MWVPGVYLPIFLLLFSQVYFMTLFLIFKQFNNVLPFAEAVKHPIDLFFLYKV